ncbi:MAG: site-specific DNA-methyltransferase [Phycisphaerales bacterium]
MAERKNTDFDRPGGYAMPKGATVVQRKAAAEMTEADVVLLGDRVESHVAETPPKGGLKPAHHAKDPDTRLYVGDCRDVLANLPDRGSVDLVFADPPFNWDVPYEEWNDGMPRAEYERFTYDWIDGCIDCLAPHGSIWVNIPDDTAAEIVLHLKRRGLTMINWCLWHFRFGQNRDSSFIMSKVHALYFCKDPSKRIWNPSDILEPSDRATVYADPRTMAKDSNKGMRVPMDVWYGKYWGRIQGNNLERRHQHHNQIPEVYLERVIRACSNEGDLVMDPFGGSGTTSTVARAWDRRSISIEFSPGNAESAWERITDVGMIRKGESAGHSSATVKKRRSLKVPGQTSPEVEVESPESADTSETSDTSA